jgi:hypothetical protein
VATYGGDIFHRGLRRTEFCRQIAAAGDPFDETCRFTFNGVGPFNGADEDCYRQPGKKVPSREPMPVRVPTLDSYAALSPIATKRFGPQSP